MLVGGLWWQVVRLTVISGHLVLLQLYLLLQVTTISRIDHVQLVVIILFILCHARVLVVVQFTSCQSYSLEVWCSFFLSHLTELIELRSSDHVVFSHIDFAFLASETRLQLCQSFSFCELHSLYRLKLLLLVVIVRRISLLRFILVILAILVSEIHRLRWDLMLIFSLKQVLFAG